MKPVLKIRRGQPEFNKRFLNWLYGYKRYLGENSWK